MASEPEEKSVLLRHWFEAAVTLFGPGAPPITFDRAIRAAKRAVAKGALELEEGNVSQAAARLDTSRRTVYRAANDNSLPQSSGLWDGLPMHAMDATLFPLVRVMWPSSADDVFTNEMLDWWLAEIIPRAASESVMLVDLHNFSTAESLPSGSMLSTMITRRDEIMTASMPHLIGTVIFAPTLPLGGFLAPLINAVTHNVKLATTPTKAINLISVLFEGAGVAPPTVQLD